MSDPIRRSFRPWVLRFSLLVLGAIASVLAVGWSLPAHHVARGEATFGDHPPQAIYQVLADWEARPKRSPEVGSVHRLPDRRGNLVVREESSFGAIEFEVLEDEPPHRMVVAIANPAEAGFAGTWTYELNETPAGGTVLVVTENGRLDNPLVRLIARLAMDPHDTMESEFASIGDWIGDPPQVRRLEEAR